MPLHPTRPNTILRGQTYDAWAWIRAIQLDAGDGFDGTITLTLPEYGSEAAAYAGGDLIGAYSIQLTGPKYRNFVRRNPALYLGLATAAQAVAAAHPNYAGAAVTPVTLPAWAAAAEEPED